MGNPVTGARTGAFAPADRRNVYLSVLLIAAAIYIVCIISPPSLMDDVDAVQAAIARNMLVSGDWVTARLDGVAYLEKAPLVYWLIGGSYKIFGVKDWAARIPVALSCIALAWLVAAFGFWAFGKKGGLYSGLCMASGVGLFLFTRILIPDVMLTFTVALAMFAFLRTLDENEPHPRLWAAILAGSLGTGLLLKSLIGIVFPIAAGLLYLLFTRQFFSARTWRRLHPFPGVLIALLIAAPWHILATLRNPPYFAWTMHSGPGQYHGFLWFFFMNEQVLRFLNLRYPHDYNTVPRLYFWLLHLVWLFPWSVYFLAVAKLGFHPIDRAGRTRLLALCWAGFVLVFFTFSTTQEYYSMPAYPALALLLGSAMATDHLWIRRGTRALGAISAAAALAALILIFLVRNVPAPGDISSALGHHPGAYTLSLGHMQDLTISSFAYLRLPLTLAVFAFAIGAFGSFRWRGTRAHFAAAIMMVLFFQAARIAMVAFDPFLSSRPIAETINRSPHGTLIVDHPYYAFASVFFYSYPTGLILNGRYNNLEYGADAPGSLQVFINDHDFSALCRQDQRYYIVAFREALPRLQSLAGSEGLTELLASGGKLLLTNHPIPPATQTLAAPAGP
jgi:4-amino-4-deoxy-L-arabinose transferase-like glycosyltransferase